MGIRIDDLPSVEQVSENDLIIVQDAKAAKKSTIGQLDAALGISELKQRFDSLGLSVDEEGYIVQEVDDE